MPSYLYFWNTLYSICLNCHKCDLKSSCCDFVQLQADDHDCGYDDVHWPPTDEDFPVGWLTKVLVKKGLNADDIIEAIKG